LEFIEAHPFDARRVKKHVLVAPSVDKAEAPVRESLNDTFCHLSNSSRIALQRGPKTPCSGFSTAKPEFYQVEQCQQPLASVGRSEPQLAANWPTDASGTREIAIEESFRHLRHPCGYNRGCIRSLERVRMLVLSRKRGERIVIADNIVITVIDIRGDKVRLGIQAPVEIPVHRKEVYDAIHRNKEKEASGATGLEPADRETSE